MLSDRLRPDCEAAPWVIAEVKKLEQALAVAEDILKRMHTVSYIGGVFSKEALEKIQCIKEGK